MLACLLDPLYLKAFSRAGKFNLKAIIYFETYIHVSSPSDALTDLKDITAIRVEICTVSNEGWKLSCVVTHEGKLKVK